MISLRFKRLNGYSKPILKTPKRYFAAPQVLVKTNETNPIQDELQDAKPFESLPGPSKFEVLRGYFPGGRFYGKAMNDINNLMRKDYGDIFLIPGLFGKNDNLVTYNPEDFEKVFRTEGPYPIRRGFDILKHYRWNHRQDVFKEAGGLTAEDGERWSSFRSTVNPVLMNPKTFKMYSPKLNRILDQFIVRVKKIRDPQTLEVPNNFEEELNFLTMETVGVVALDTHLGLIDQKVVDKDVKEFMSLIREFFVLLFQLQMKPSLWKLVETPKYKKFVSTTNRLTDLIIKYVEGAKERIRMEEAKGITKPEFEKSLLERLIKINPAVATVMAMDTILAGTDTTTGGMVSCLIGLATSPEKQQKLREEILEILPQKDTPLTPEKMNKLPYLRASIKECFRLYPVVNVNFRTTGQDVVLSGYRIPKDTDVVMPSQDLLKDERNYTRSKEFIPERWLQGDAGKDENGCPMRTSSPFVYIPFGFGPRMCVGKRIVDLQLEVYIAKLVRNFDIRYEYSTDDIFKAHFNNIPGKPLNFKFIDIN